MSDTVLKLIASLPDAADPGSDAYMTALSVVLMRQSGCPRPTNGFKRPSPGSNASNGSSGRWWMHSLYRGNYHYITYIATARTSRPLALCDELPEVAEEVATR